MEDLYKEIRKAELHLHLEGSVEPETLLEINPDLDLQVVRSKYIFTDFAGFIQSYVYIVRQLRTPAHYGLVTRRLLSRLAEQNVAYAEINLSTGVILWKEQDFYGIFEAVRQAAAESPVEVNWIFDAVRQFGAEPARRVAELAVELRDEGVVAFGIGGDEPAGPAGWFAHLFRYAQDNGIAVVPHAGETAGAESVWACVNAGAARIGHGIRSIADPELLACLRERDIPLEVCISSNVWTGAVASIEEHPVRRLFDAGVPITLNSDDPAMFGCSLTSEYRLAAEQFGFTEAELRVVAENAFRYRLGGGSRRPRSLSYCG